MLQNWIEQLLLLKQCRIKVDGSGQVTLTNRYFLPKYVPATTSISQSPSQHGITTRD